MSWPRPRKRQIDRDLQDLARLGALHVERPTIDGLAAAADIKARPSTSQPMDGTLVMLSMSPMAAGTRGQWHRTLESILLLPERAR